MATFTTCTHVGDEKRVQVNLDVVQSIEAYQNGALIKFLRGAQSALHVRETPEQIMRGTSSQGSLRINTATGKWVDMETGNAGSDTVSLIAFLQGLPQLDAARRISRLLDLPLDEAAKERRMTIISGGLN